MSTAKKLLEVGDVVYRFWEGQLDRRYTIDRVTKTQAIIADAIRLKRLICENGEIDNTEKFFNRSSYKLETPELIEQYKPIELRESIKDADLSTCTIEQLRQVCKILNIKTD